MREVTKIKDRLLIWILIFYNFDNPKNTKKKQWIFSTRFIYCTKNPFMRV